MKQKLLLLLAMLSYMGMASADKLTIEDVVIPKGGQGTIIVNYQFDAAELYSGWQFSLELSEEVATVKNDRGTSQFSIGSCHDASYTVSSSYVGGVDSYVALSLESSPITGMEGVLLSIPVTAGEEQEIGSRFLATIKEIQFGNKDGVHTVFFDDVEFYITIAEQAEPWTILDENSTSVPEATDGAVDIKVIRTINANQWSTICLPFDMTEAQLKAAFGEDVQLAEFSDYEVEYDESDNVVGLTVNFNDTDMSEGFYANYPYLIKTSQVPIHI